MGAILRSPPGPVKACGYFPRGKPEKGVNFTADELESQWVEWPDEAWCAGAGGGVGVWPDFADGASDTDRRWPSKATGWQ
jgi:hypothetical protein